MKNLMILVILVVGFIYYNRVDLDSIKIPDEAIRLRVVANSNTEEDQNKKLEVKEELEEKLALLLDNVDNINLANMIIEKNLDLFDDVVYQILQDNNFRVDYGMNYFPEKEYMGIYYDEGQYQSLVVTLGDGKGENWWCVLFPPLCMLETEQTQEVEYKFFVMELIDKIFNN